MTVEDRFIAKVDKTGACWRWTAYRYPNGYGFFRLRRGVAVYAHRFAYEMWRGPIPNGMEIDHLCRNRACVNPEHLEVVTHAENCRRAGGRPRPKRLGEICNAGHPRTAENTGVNVNGARFCRPCRRDAVRRHRQARIA